MKTTTFEVRAVAVRNPDKAAALATVERACVGLNAIVRALRPMDATLLDLHRVPEGGMRML